MSKNTKRQSKKQNNLFVIGGLSVVVVVVIGIFFWRQFTVNPVSKISPTDYQQQFATTGKSHVLIDVRTSEEFSSEHIAGAMNIPLQSLADRLSEVPHDKPVILYCHSGNRSSQAAAILSKAGYTNILDMGGILAWSAAGFPTVQ